MFQHLQQLRLLLPFPVQQIIDYGKENGYTFAAIQKDTPAVHHSINN